jgi:hypothetical protein
MGWRIEMEFRLRCGSLLGLVLRTDEFQGGTEELCKHVVHFAAQATNLGRTSAGGVKKRMVKIWPKHRIFILVNIMHVLG